MLITGVSKKGGRPVNEDAYGEVRANGILCAVVADGLGGHYGGEVASRLAVDTIIKEFKKAPAFSADALKGYIKAANTAIGDAAMTDPQNVHMATTVIVLLKKGKRAIWANVGDSRLYRFLNNKLVEVTEDHSLAFHSFVSGHIEYDDIRKSPDQNKLTNALGPALGEINVSDIITVNVDTSFLLCTDGWWEHITEDRMEETLRASRDPRSWIRAMLAILEDGETSDYDNYTAVAIMI